VEAGHRLTDPSVVARLSGALGLGARQAGELVALAERAYAVPVRRRVDAGVSMVAGQLHRHLSACDRVWSFSSAMVPALLRTGEYASAVATARGSAEDQVRVARLVEDASRSLVFVVTEGALRTWPGEVPMDAQLAQVTELSRRPNVRLSVLPWGAALPQVLLHDFLVAGDRAVWLETFTAEFTLTDPADVAAYRDAFAGLQAAAVFGEAARELVGRIAAEFGSGHPGSIQ
jgi:hypothetical protein